MIEVKYLYICIGVCASITIYWFVDSIIRAKKYNIISRGLSAYIQKFGEHTFLFDDESGEVYIEEKDNKKK